MGKTSIEWTDASWNPIVGCTEVSPGCANCYAARLAASRLRGTQQYGGLAVIQDGDRGPSSVPRHPRWTGEVRFLSERLEEPLHWKKPRRIFVCDMGDLFHEGVKPEWLHQVLRVIFECPQHTFQILTKRAKRMRELMDGKDGEGRVFGAWPFRNVWLGVSVENQHFADERIPLLLDTPASVHFISAEPLLGPVNLHFEWLRPGVDWLICGGESGPNARPMHPDWARALRDQCVTAGVPFFFKQWGEWVDPQQNVCALHSSGEHNYVADGREHSEGCPNAKQFVVKMGKKKAGRLLDGREWNEFPKGGGA